MWQIRDAQKKDLPAIRSLAEAFNLDSEEMRAEEFKVAVENGQIIGICRLRPSRDFFELCSLGVVKSKQGRGVGKLLVHSFLRSAKKEVYLATIIPDYFKKFGFKPLDFTPKFMQKNAEWCEGCCPERCVVMKWTPPEI